MKMATAGYVMIGIGIFYVVAGSILDSKSDIDLLKLQTDNMFDRQTSDSKRLKALEKKAGIGRSAADNGTGKA